MNTARRHGREPQPWLGPHLLTSELLSGPSGHAEAGFRVSAHSTYFSRNMTSPLLKAWPGPTDTASVLPNAACDNSCQSLIAFHQPGLIPHPEPGGGQPEALPSAFLASSFIGRIVFPKVLLELE